MSRKRRHDVIEEKLFNNTVCAFCSSDEDNELLYGKVIISDDIAVHSNCLYFASGLSQEGEESEGLNGFFKSDIELELERGKKLFCAFCHRRQATVGCSNKKCKKTFHLNCGLAHGALCQFFGSFMVFCKDHKPMQKHIEIDEDLFCYICCEQIVNNDSESCLYPPCCKKNFFHKICLQKYALSAGLYFFKCPLCNNSREFVKEMEFYGINIPDKDASWELEDHAYQDLYTRPDCDAENCLCPKGRKYCATKKKSGWRLLTCSVCGSHARHRNCENLKKGVNTWLCKECKGLEEEIQKKSSANINRVEEETTSVSDLEKNFALQFATEADISRSDQEGDNSKLRIKEDKPDDIKEPGLSSANEDEQDTSITISQKFESSVEEHLLESYRESGAWSKSRSKENFFSNTLSENHKRKKLIEIKNTYLDVLKSPLYKKPKKSKKKKRNVRCCGQNHSCIGKYFGLHCTNCST